MSKPPESPPPDSARPEPESRDFIREIVASDVATGKHGGRVQTRFPPEPNGYLHVGHAKAICLSFGIAQEFGGQCNLRFDDTNPETEEVEFVEAIKDDIRWLGFDWADREYYASDYFAQLHAWAVKLIEKGKAYVDHLSADEISEHRGTLTAPGRPSPWRERSVAENLELFERMRRGEFAEGECVLRAKIDMAHPNVNLRDPLMYRIRKASHYRTGGKWCIYPMYDWAHGQCDSIERITHSLCTLEFEHHRPLYDWYIQELGIFPSRQIEFARLNLTHTVLSKRWLLKLVDGGVVRGWDDPRMPTLRGMRRRGYTPEALRAFCAHIGIAKFNAVHEIALLEFCLREDLNQRCPRRLGVLRPLKLVLTDWPKGKVEMVEAINNPEDPAAGSREVPFSGEVWIERDDWRDDPPKDWFRLAPGREVRLRYAYVVRCDEVLRDAAGQPIELRCSHDPATRSGTPQGRKVKGTIHWVSAAHAIDAEVRLYEHLFAHEDPHAAAPDGDFLQVLNPRSLEVLSACKLEPSLAQAKPEDRLQLERLGYFCVDKDSKPGALVLNRTVTLKDTWAKVEKKAQRA